MKPSAFHFMSRLLIAFLALLLSIQSYSQMGPSDDFDGDGIQNSLDLDDDNDGIPDNLECNQSHFYWSNPPTISNPQGGPYTATGTINVIPYTYTSTSPIGATGSVYAYGTFPASYAIPNVNPTIRNDFATTNTLSFASPMTNPVLVFASIGNGNLSVPIQFNDDIQIEWSRNVVLNNSKQITGREGYAIVRIMGTFSSLTFKYLTAESWCNFVFGADFQDCGDIDNDGFPNKFDNDSDNDGCPDAIEGGLNFSAADLDGNLRLTGGVDANGVPLVAGAAGQQPGSSYKAAISSCDPLAYPVLKSVSGAPTVTSLNDKPLQGSQDAAAQQSWAGNTVTIASLPTNDFVLTYNGHAVDQNDIDAGGYVIANYNPVLLSIAPGSTTPGTAKETSFQYSVTRTASPLNSSDNALYTVQFSQSLPVTFGPVSGYLSNGKLNINWQSLTELNNEKFIIQLSSDGKAFYTIGEQKTKAHEGNSNGPVDYEFSMTEDAAKGLFASLALLGLCALSTVGKRKQLQFFIISLVTMAIIFGGNACNKKNDIQNGKNADIYLRIGQVDKDGGIMYSKVVKVIKR